MIPKKIHYIWFGRGEKNERIKICLDSWKKLGYEIVEWNEDNFPMDICPFFEQAYERGKWAYCSDVARMWILFHYGGIYLDTDVEDYKSLDEFLDSEGFIGFEDIHYLSTAVIGACQYNPVIKLILDFYYSIDFKEYAVWTDYIANQETSPCIVSNLFELLGLKRDLDEYQEVKHFKIYPRSYFHTKDEGYTYHSYNGGW